MVGVGRFSLILGVLQRPINMIKLNVTDETSRLGAVVLGTAKSFGGTPSIEEAYDPKSIEHIKNGTFPKEEDLIAEMEEFAQVFFKYDVTVYRPEVIEDYNQIFSRDISFVINDRLVIPEILPHRKKEVEGIRYLIDRIDPKQILRAKNGIRIEGGDVMPWKGKLFVGYSKEPDFSTYTVARTNEAGVEFLMNNFKDLDVHAFELKKSDTDPKENALHLDCCFQPIGTGTAIIYKGGFKNEKDYQYLVDFFGTDNVIEIDKEEMYQMNSNVFSISPEVVVSENGFSRVNTEMRNRGFTVETIKYSETAKMEGLLRCSTMPLYREK